MITRLSPFSKPLPAPTKPAASPRFGELFIVSDDLTKDTPRLRNVLVQRLPNLDSYYNRQYLWAWNFDREKNRHLLVIDGWDGHFTASMDRAKYYDPTLRGKMAVPTGTYDVVKANPGDLEFIG